MTAFDFTKTQAEQDMIDYGYQRGRCMYCNVKMATDSGVWVCEKRECTIKYNNDEEPPEEF
jgi:hypothetical protein